MARIQWLYCQEASPELAATLYVRLATCAADAPTDCFFEGFYAGRGDLDALRQRADEAEQHELDTPRRQTRADLL